jgi:hypothetical protein
MGDLSITDKSKNGCLVMDMDGYVHEHRRYYINCGIDEWFRFDIEVRQSFDNFKLSQFTRNIIELFLDFFFTSNFTIGNLIINNIPWKYTIIKSKSPPKSIPYGFNGTI